MSTRTVASTRSYSLLIFVGHSWSFLPCRCSTLPRCYSCVSNSCILCSCGCTSGEVLIRARNTVREYREEASLTAAVAPWRFSSLVGIGSAVATHVQDPGKHKLRFTWWLCGSLVNVLASSWSSVAQRTGDNYKFIIVRKLLNIKLSSFNVSIYYNIPVDVVNQ